MCVNNFSWNMFFRLNNLRKFFMSNRKFWWEWCDKCLFFSSLWFAHQTWDVLKGTWQPKIIYIKYSITYAHITTTHHDDMLIINNFFLRNQSAANVHRNIYILRAWKLMCQLYSFLWAWRCTHFYTQNE